MHHPISGQNAVKLARNGCRGKKYAKQLALEIVAACSKFVHVAFLQVIFVRVWSWIVAPWSPVFQNLMMSLTQIHISTVQSMLPVYEPTKNNYVVAHKIFSQQWTTGNWPLQYLLTSPGHKIWNSVSAFDHVSTLPSKRKSKYWSYTWPGAGFGRLLSSTS